MDKNLDNQINNIKRLINYSRSKTLLEQSQNPNPKASVEVGPIKTHIGQSEIQISKYEDFTGKNLNPPYPQYCKYPDKAIEGTTEKPVIKDYCIYQGPKKIGPMYLPKTAKLQFIDSDGDYEEIMNNFSNKYPQTFSGWTDDQIGLFDLDLRRELPIGSLRQISIDSENYTLSMVRKKSEKVWFFYGFRNQDGFNYQEPKIEVTSDVGDVFWHEMVKMSNKGFDQMAALFCGDNSPFSAMGNVGLLSAISIEYKWSEFACDIFASLLMFFGPVGVTAGASIEFLHARDLWNKNDKFGAALSLIIGLLPIFGDLGAISLRQLVNTIGQKGFVKVISIFVNTIKFLSGDLPATVIWDSIRTLNKTERELLFKLYANSTTYLKKVELLPRTFEQILKKLNDLGYTDTWVHSSVKNILEVLENISPLKTLLNFGVQMSSIFTLIFGARIIQELGFTGTPTEEELEKIFLKLLENTKNTDLFKPLTDEEKIELFEKNYPCVLNHPNSEKINYGRIDRKTGETKPEIAYLIDGEVYTYDGLRTYNKSKLLTHSYDCNFKIFNQ
jgi:hypothetical protein